MSIDVLVEFIFKSGKTKTISWIEPEPKLIQKDKDTGEVVREVPMTPSELKREVLNRLLSQDDKRLVMEGKNKNLVYIDLTEVASVTVDAWETSEQE